MFKTLLRAPFLLLLAIITITLGDEKECRKLLNPTAPVNATSCKAFDFLMDCLKNCLTEIPASIEQEYSKFYSCPPVPSGISILRPQLLSSGSVFGAELRDKIVALDNSKAYDCILRTYSGSPEENGGCSSFWDLHRCLYNAEVQERDRHDLIELIKVRGFNACGEPLPGFVSHMAGSKATVSYWLVYFIIICGLMQTWNIYLSIRA